MIKKLVTNLSLKLISLVSGIIVWAVVMNVVNPVINGFVNLNVNIENENVVYDQNKTYFLLDSRNVRVSYKTKSNNQMNIKQSDFNAYIDLKDIANVMDTTLSDKNVTVRLDISPEVESVISNVVVEPNILKVAIDDVLRNEYKVQYSFIGDAGQGHTIGNVILSPNVVYVSGSDEALANIDHVSIDIPVPKNEETFSGVSKIKIYSPNGDLLPNEGVILSAEDIGYTVVLNSTSNITLNALTEGDVAAGYRLVETVVNPSTIVIEGPRSFVKNIYTFDLPSIDITGLTETSEYKFKLSEILPVGVISKTIEAVVTVVVDKNVINAPAETRVGPHLDNENETTEESESAKVIETSSKDETVKAETP